MCSQSIPTSSTPSTEPLTPEESQRAAELVTQLIPWVSITVSGISDDDAVLLRRAMREVDSHHRRMATESIVYMAMGIGDPTQTREFKRQQRNVPIVLKALELRDIVITSAQEEAEDGGREAQRRELMERMGLA